MDFKPFLEHFGTMTCVMSVERKEGGYGDIRIVAGNEAYIKSIEQNENADIPNAKNNRFVPNSLYDKYFPKDLNFEDFCYRAALLGQVMHTYVQPDRFDIWFNLVMLPLASDREDIGYCIYTYEVTATADSSQMTDLSLKISNDVLRTCIKLRGATDFEKTIEEVVGDIRSICGADRCCLLLTDLAAETCTLLGESHEEGVESARKYVSDDFIEVVKTWPDTIAGSDCLIIKNKQDMQFIKERNEVWYESLNAAGVNSLVLFPLRYNKETVGYIWVTEFDTQNTPEIKRTLELTTFFLASEIANYRLLKKLEYMSSVDMLTGIRNRNAMNERVRRLTDGEDKYPDGLWVIFADLNGLKKMNDEKGHIAGDLLLKNAAVTLEQVFLGQEIYRAGGDEFVVIASGYDEAKVEECVAQLREISESPAGPSFAVGVCGDEGRQDIRGAMSEADARMYADKELYYTSHPKYRPA